MNDIVQRIAMKALIVSEEGKVLVLREAKTYAEGTQIGRYHVPGGRLEADEPHEEGLRREVREETGLEISIEQPLYIGEWRPVIKGVPHQIVAVFMVCKPASAQIKLSHEHDDYQWIDPANPEAYDIMPPEDVVMDRLAKYLQKQNPA